MQSQVVNLGSQTPESKMKSADFHSRSCALFDLLDQRAANPAVGEPCREYDDDHEGDRNDQD